MNVSYSSIRLTAFIASAVLLSAGLEGAAHAQFPGSNGHRYTEPAGRGAFLRHSAYSTDELLSEIQNDPTLRRRYARHFGLSEAKVVDNFRSTLIPYRLPKDRVVMNYGVTPSGAIFGTRTRLKRGTMVWATRSGLPVLKWACANPLTKSLPGTKLGAAPRTAKPKPAAPLAAASSPEAEITPAPENEMAAVPALMPPTSLGTESSALAAPPLLSGAGSSFIPAVTGLTVGRPGGFGPGVLLSLLPFFVDRGHNNGGTDTVVVGGPVTGGGTGGDTVVVTGPGGGGTTVPPVGGGTLPPGGVGVAPEPGTFALIAIAGLPFGAIALRRRRRKAA